MKAIIFMRSKTFTENVYCEHSCAAIIHKDPIYLMIGETDSDKCILTRENPALNLQKQDCSQHFINCKMPVHWSINGELPFSLLLFFLYVRSAKIRNKNALLLHILTFFSSTKQRIQVITHYKFWPSDQNYEVYRIHLKCLTGH